MNHKNSRHFGNYIQPQNNWTCFNCNIEIYGSKKICVKCLKSNTSLKNLYISQDLLKSNEWVCPTCKFRIYKDTKYCNRCKIDCNGNKETTI
jgi:hypothetical protein